MSAADDILKDLNDRIAKTLDDLKRELSSVRTGRANLHLPDGVRVELTPGAGLPRRIAIRGPEGDAVLTLETFAAVPEAGGANG